MAHFCRRRGLLPWWVSCALLSCTGHVPLRADDLRDIHKLAVVVRVTGGPTVALAPETMPRGMNAARLARAMAAQMSAFEIAERIRSSAEQRLPSKPPFTDVVPSVQVDSALGSLLVQDPSAAPNFRDLAQVGADGVLFVEIRDWGVDGRDGLPRLYLRGRGRLFTLGDDSSLWKSPIELRGPDGPLPADWSGQATLHELVGELCARAGTFVAEELGGSSQSVHVPSALDQPEIEDRGHPPEQRAPVLPLGFALDAGTPGAGPPDAGAPGDGGDNLFPGDVPPG